VKELTIRELPAVFDDVEVVEHKGVGHPDTICDGIAEAASRALSRVYLERHGTILHHNVDKALLVGGRANVRLGGGELLEPIFIHLAGRATGRYASEVIVDAAREWLRGTLHALDVERHVRIRASVHPGSSALVDLFDRGRGANDTSIGAGHAPLSAVERAVLAVADRLRALSASADGIDVGEDTKILAIRRAHRLELTIACALIGPRIPSLERYVERRDEIARVVRIAVEEIVGSALDVHVVVNAADDIARGSVYLTVTGTSAEAGDDGQVGRGNRVNGLITPGRPMTLEAAAGKNPMTHVGKLYNVAAHMLANELVTILPEIVRAECLLASRIGAPVAEPALVDARVALRSGASLVAVRPRIAEIVAAQLATIPVLWQPILRGEIRLY
jgi:S-adenosylmethionine synthetase